MLPYTCDGIKDAFLKHPQKLRGGSKENVIRSVFDEFEDGVEKVQPYTKKSQQNGNVCRLIVSKSALIKHVSRGEVF